MPHVSTGTFASRRIAFLALLAAALGLLCVPDAGFKSLRPTARAQGATLPTVTIPIPVVAEGNSGTTTLFFTVKLSAPSAQTVKVGYSTQDGTAHASEDYLPASGTLVFNPGETVKQIPVTVNGDTEPEHDEAFGLNITSLEGATAPTDTSAGGIIWDDDSPGLHFSAPSYHVGEKDGSVEIKVVRRGDASGTATGFVAIFTLYMPDEASPISDYTGIGVVTLDFAPGETEKSFTILVNDDAYVEGTEVLLPVLLTEVPFELKQARVYIDDDDTQPPTPANNPVDDTAFFVRQHYHDFLNREPDPQGFQFWTNSIEQCGADAQCREVKRISVSEAFFFSIEYQQTGFRFFRFYRATFTNDPFMLDTRGMPGGGQLPSEMQEVGRGLVVGQDGWQERLRQNVEKFARDWVTRSEVTRVLPNTLTGAQFVDKLFANSGVAPTAQERNAALAAYGAGGTEGRAAALLSVTDSRSVFNRQYNDGFVYAEYAGYLRRLIGPPEGTFAGFDFWLAKLNSFTQPGEDARDESVALRRVERAEMVKAFISSAEYRQRFGL